MSSSTSPLSGPSPGPSDDDETARLSTNWLSEASPGPSDDKTARHTTSSHLLNVTSSKAEPFEMDDGTNSYTDQDGKLSSSWKRYCYGLGLDTRGKDDDGEHKLSGTFALFSVIILMSVGILTVKHLDAKLPNALQIKDIEKHPTSFIEERARRDLHHLTSVGVRVSGSYETDNVTVEMILDILRHIRSHGLSRQASLDFEVHRPTGCFYRTTGRKVDEYTSCYSKASAFIQYLIANIVAKLEPTDPSRITSHSILVNCHFDTKPGTPGASDNMINCVTMLEVIRVLAKEEPTSLKNPVVFLFNGAEELYLQGAHGFMKGYDGPLGNVGKNEVGHRWTKNLRTFINLEGAGGGGREILFQTGPGNSWTLEAYASAAPYPYGVVIAEEAFQIGLIPSDTDFRIFRDFGNGLAGLDMAFAKNGWVYHTKWDKVNEIPPGSIQHVGANALAIVRHLSSKVDFSKINFDPNGKMVYFDVLGLFMIYYPRWAGMIIDCLIGLGSISAIAYNGKSKNTRNLVMTLIWLPISAILSWCAGILAAVLVALFLNACGYYKPFFTYPTLAIVIFGLPAAISQIILHSYAQNRSPVQTWMAQKLALAVILVIMTFITRAVFIISINLLFSVISWHLLRFLCRGWPGATSLTYLIFGEFIPFLFSFYLLSTLSDVFVPILGRSGSEMNANLFYGVITAAVVVLLIWSGFCFLFVQFRRRILWLSLVSVFFIGNSLLVFGYIGKIPYQEKTPMRINIVDVDRTWYNSDGVTANRMEFGYWFWPYDSNMKDFFPTLEKSVPEFSSIQETKVDYGNCKDLYCAQPFVWPIVKSIKKTYWLPRTRNQSLSDNLTTPAIMAYKVSGSSNELQRTVEFSVDGPAQFSFVLSPGLGYKLSKWTLTETVPEKIMCWKGRAVYFIYHGRGVEMQTIRFNCTFEWVGNNGLEQSAEPTLATVQYSAFYLYGSDLMTGEFQDMVNRLPGWTYTMPWTADLKMYEII